MHDSKEERLAAFRRIRRASNRSRKFCTGEADPLTKGVRRAVVDFVVGQSIKAQSNHRLENLGDGVGVQGVPTLHDDFFRLGIDREAVA